MIKKKKVWQEYISISCADSFGVLVNFADNKSAHAFLGRMFKRFDEGHRFFYDPHKGVMISKSAFLYAFVSKKETEA